MNLFFNWEEESQQMWSETKKQINKDSLITSDFSFLSWCNLFHIQKLVRIIYIMYDVLFSITWFPQISTTSLLRTYPWLPILVKVS